MRWRRREEPSEDTFLSEHGITEQEFRDLARFNSEVASGVTHTEEHQRKMALLQAKYNIHWLAPILDERNQHGQ